MPGGDSNMESYLRPGLVPIPANPALAAPRGALPFSGLLMHPLSCFSRYGRAKPPVHEQLQLNISIASSVYLVIFVPLPLVSFVLLTRRRGEPTLRRVGFMLRSGYQWLGCSMHKAEARK